jgi:hypothetical protein
MMKNEVDTKKILSYLLFFTGVGNVAPTPPSAP